MSGQSHTPGQTNGHAPTRFEFQQIFRQILGPEASYYRLGTLLSAFISLLTLAVPISIQMLIDQVANTQLIQPVILLSLTLFGLLLLSSLFYVAREYVMELFERRIYARLAAEITLKILGAPAAYFDRARRDGLINRYFDIMTLNLTVPYLLVGLFTFFFQAAIGFTVTSLYHPYLLVFNIAVTGTLAAIWWVWSWRATETAFAVSESKYDTAAFVEGLAQQADLFKAGPHGRYATDSANTYIKHHIDHKKAHFRITVSQLVSLLILYAASSATLLGLGGFLVIENQLTLGQLVAAELILSAIFAEFAALGGYWKYYYRLCAATEEIHRVQGIPDSQDRDTMTPPEGAGLLTLSNARIYDGGETWSLSLTLETAGDYRLNAPTPTTRRMIARLLKGHIGVSAGFAQVDELDLANWHPHDLHEEVVVLDRPTLPQMTIAELLRLADPAIGRADMVDALDKVGMQERVSKLKDGLDTMIAPSGWPLTFEESLRLKLAASVLDAPRLLVLTDLFDCIGEACLTEVTTKLRTTRPMTMLILSDRTDLKGWTDIDLTAERSTISDGRSYEHD